MNETEIIIRQLTETTFVVSFGGSSTTFGDEADALDYATMISDGAQVRRVRSI